MDVNETKSLASFCTFLSSVWVILLPRIQMEKNQKSLMVCKKLKILEGNFPAIQMSEIKLK